MSNQNNKIEQIVLGAILQDEANYWAISDMVSMDLFCSEDHQKIFAVIHELACDGRAIRVQIVAGRIGSLRDGQEPEAYLSMLLHTAGREDAIPLSDYVTEMRDTATRRKVIDLAESILKAARNVKHDAQEICERATERLADIARSATLEYESTVSSTFAKVAEQASKPAGGGAIRPCLRGLEDMVSSFPMGSLVLIGGGPGSAKTSLAMQQMLYSSTIHPATFFQLEMEPTSLVVRATSKETGVTMRDMMRGVSEEQYKAILKAQQDYAARLLRFVSPAKMTIQQIRNRAFSHKKKYGLDIMAVDHIKLIERPSKVRMDAFERAYENARDLKALAKDLNCVVLGLCQFTKAARQKENPEPEMEDFYGGSLEEHADIMLANFNRYDWYERNPPSNSGKMKEKWDQDRLQHVNKIEVHKLKDRFGSPRDRRIFDWDGKATRFMDRGLVSADLFGSEL